jgi:NAD(P)-dependent dehydrogenase (short-subunit alcohol dehydrogenase family)
METSDWDENWPDEMGQRQPLGRLLHPEDVATMVAYLLSREAEMVTGQVWDFDQRTFGG